MLITPGKTFTEGEQVTHTELNQAITSATVSGLSQEELASTCKLVIVSATAPAGPGVGQPWYDTTNRLCKFWSGRHWVAQGGPGMTRQAEMLYAKATGAIDPLEEGMVLGISTAADLTVTTQIVTTSTYLAIGVTPGGDTDGTQALFTTWGPAKVRLGTGISAAKGHGLQFHPTEYGKSYAEAQQAGQWYYGVALETISAAGLGWAWIFGCPRKF